MSSNRSKRIETLRNHLAPIPTSNGIHKPSETNSNCQLKINHTASTTTTTSSTDGHRDSTSAGNVNVNTNANGNVNGNANDILEANKSNNQVSGSNNRRFRYTMDYPAGRQNILSEEQRIQYERDGFVVIPGLLSEEKIDRWIEHFRDLASHPEKRDESMSVVRDVSLSRKGVSKEQANSEEMITKFQDFLFDEVFFEFAKDPEVLKYIEAFTGPEEGIQAMHSMLINKPPDTGAGSSRHPMHQDHWYFPWKPVDRTVASWVAMQDINEENGCLQVIPGSHRTELLLHGYPDDGTVNAAYHQILGLDEEVTKKAQRCIMRKGDAVFFHPLLWHGSGPNYSSGFRKAISVHYASTACKYISVQNTIQEVIQDEVRQLAKLKLKGKGIEATDEMMASLPLSDIWKNKSRLVKGDQEMEDAEEDF